MSLSEYRGSTVPAYFTDPTIKQDIDVWWCPWPRVWLRINGFKMSRCVQSRPENLTFVSFLATASRSNSSGENDDALRTLTKPGERLRCFYLQHHLHKYIVEFAGKKLWCHLAASANRHSGWLPSSRDQDLRRPHDPQQKTSKSHPKSLQNDPDHTAAHRPSTEDFPPFSL